jgi:PAS domain S-box-containing protein
MALRFRPWKSLHIRLILTTTCLFLVSLLSLSYVTSRIMRDDLHELLVQQQSAAVTMVVARLNDELVLRVKSLQKISKYSSDLILKPTSDLQSQLNRLPMFNELFNDGVFICHKNGNMVEKSLSTNQLCDEEITIRSATATFENENAKIGPLVLGKNGKDASFTISVPVYNASGEMVGLIVGVIKLGNDNFLDDITKNSYGKSGGYLIVDRPLRTVMSATDRNRLMEALPKPGINIPLDHFLSGFEGSQLMKNPSGQDILATDKLVPGTDWILGCVFPTEEAFAPIRRIEQHLIMGTILLTLLAAFISWYLLKRQLEPLLSTVKALEGIVSGGVTSEPLLIKRDDEIGALVTTFNKVIKMLDQREKELEKSDIFGRAILNSVTSEIAVLDQNGLIIMVNTPWNKFALDNCILPGIQPCNTGLGTNYLDICKAGSLDPGNLDALSAYVAIERVLTNNLPIATLEYACDSDSKKRWYSMVVTPLDHNVRGAVVSHTDITDRKLAERALQLTQISISVASDALFWLTKEGRIYDANPMACKILGYTMGEILTLHVSDLGSNKRYKLENWQMNFAMIKLRKSTTFQSKILTRLGIRVPVEISVNYVKFGEEEFICAVVRDTTSRKRIEAKLAHAKAEAETANRAKSRFLAAASHDLRQPLSALTLYVDLLKQRASAENSGIVESIQHCVTSLSELLTDLLDISKLDANAMLASKTDFSLDELLKTLATVYEIECRSKNLQFRLRHSVLLVHSDKKLLHRIIGNLISNAIRYTEQGGILIGCRRHDDKWWLEIWDTGVGIDGAHTDAIFEEFKQLGDESRNRGSGLGLSIVKKMATLLGLQIRVSSHLGRGSMFALELPIVTQAQSNVLSNTSDTITQEYNIVDNEKRQVYQKPNQGAQPTTSAPERKLIGIVDDNPQVLQALVFALTNNGYQVVAAATCKKLMEELGDRPPHLLLSDYRLSDGETGYDVIDTARSIFGAGLPVLIMTGDTDPTVIRSMNKHGIKIIYKPLQFDVLQAIIAETIKQGPA